MESLQRLLSKTIQVKLSRKKMTNRVNSFYRVQMDLVAAATLKILKTEYNITKNCRYETLQFTLPSNRM